MLFNKLVITYMRATASDIEIVTDRASNLKRLQIRGYRFFEIDNNCVVVRSDSFYAECTTWEQLEFLLKAITHS